MYTYTCIIYADICIFVIVLAKKQIAISCLESKLPFPVAGLFFF